MADYLSFASEIPISDAESSDSDEELNVTDLTLEEEPEVQFNHPSIESEDLATAPVLGPEISRKHPQDVALDEEKLIEGSGLFAK